MPRLNLAGHQRAQARALEFWQATHEGKPPTANVRRALASVCRAPHGRLPLWQAREGAALQLDDPAGAEFWLPNSLDLI